MHACPRILLVALLLVAATGCGSPATERASGTSAATSAGSIDDVVASVEQQLAPEGSPPDRASDVPSVGCEHADAVQDGDAARIAAVDDAPTATEVLSSCTTQSGAFRLLVRASSDERNPRWRVYSIAVPGRAPVAATSTPVRRLVDVSAPTWTDVKDGDQYHSETKLSIGALRDECACAVVSIAVEQWQWDEESGEPDYDVVGDPVVAFDLVTGSRLPELPSQLAQWRQEADASQAQRAAQLQQQFEATTRQNVASPPAGHILNGAEAAQMLELSLGPQQELPPSARGGAETSCGTNVTETSASRTTATRAHARGERPAPPELLGPAAQALVSGSVAGVLRKPCLSPDGRFLVAIATESSAVGEVLVVHAFDFRAASHRVLQRVEPLARRSSVPLDPGQPVASTGPFTYRGAVAIEIPYSINGGGGGPQFNPRTYALGV